MNRYFGTDDISNFCRITRDYNPLHNASFMAEQGKKEVVPGMLNFLSFIPYFELEKLYNVDFKKILSSGSLVKDVSSNGKIKVISGGECTLEISKLDSNFLSFENSFNYNISPSYQDFEDFEDLVGTNNDLAFPIALSSSVLVNIIKNYEVTSNLKEKITNFKALPVYKNLSFVPFSEKVHNSFVYKSNLRSTGKRGLEFCVDCYSNDRLLFKEKAELEMVPTRIILWLCEDLEKKNDRLCDYIR